MPTTGGLHGHTHVPIAYVEDDGRLETMSPGAGSSLTLDGRRVLLNPGSVGQPRDGIPTASWMLLETDDRAGDVAADRLRRRVGAGGDGGPGPARAAGGPPVVWALGRGAHDRRPTADQRAEAGRQARPRRAPPRALLPVHRPGPADGQGRRERPDDHARRRSACGSRARSSGGRWPTRRRSASACPRRRRSRSSARTRSRPPPTRPRRSSSRSSWPGSRASRSTSPCRSRSRSPLLLGIVAFSYRQVCLAYPSGGGSYSVSKANFGRMASLVAASALMIDYTLTVAVSTSSAVEQLVVGDPGPRPRPGGDRRSSRSG